METALHEASLLTFGNVTLFIKDVRTEMSAEAYDQVSELASHIPAKLLRLYENKVIHGKGERQYDEAIRKFSISLHMKSASAYRYVRECCGTALPNERTLRKWCQKVDCTPGFSEGALKYLASKSLEYQEKQQHLLCSLTFDEMAIREHVQFDGKQIY
jgi:hypothetical protein